MLKMDAVTAAPVQRWKQAHLRLKIQGTPLTHNSYSIAIKMQRNILKGHLFVVTLKKSVTRDIGVSEQRSHVVCNVADG